ncbi:MAG: CDP-diacylglycerol--serine O-phosphatidyltransferase [Deltaproteobacteria bacterium]|nr:CDP-diacylglycerol--serine O-phosphatidyltransferase [Deltaproteobacteria bacterium]
MKSNPKKAKNKVPKRGVYVLPNLLTSASLFSGFYSIIASIQGMYETAAIAIFISCIFDALDGKIARITNTTSDFGTEYDSLSDLIAFGVAPSILAFQWALRPFGRLGWLAAFVYLICGALRLARFNVQKNSVEANYFKGLPIPGAACFMASIILFSTAIGGLSEGKHILIITTIYILSFLMVSTIDYPSFKELELTRKKTFNMLVTVILMLIVVAYKPKIMLFLLLLAYIFAGPLITIIRYHKKGSKTKVLFQDIIPSKISEDIDKINEQES